MAGTTTARVTIANQKGGAGKTTDVIHIGGALSARGYDVLLVDIDYHGGLTCSLGYSDLYYDTDRTTLFDVLEFHFELCRLRVAIVCFELETRE